MNEKQESQKQDEFQVGDVVWDVLDGKGKVTAVVHLGDATYPIEVHFDNGLIGWFTEDGRCDEGYSVRSLFFSEPKIEAAVTRPFVSTLVGKRVGLIPKHDESLFWIYTVHKEDADKIYVDNDDDSYYFKEDLAAIYEVSSESLLKK